MKTLLDRLEESSCDLCHEAAVRIRNLIQEARETEREFQREARDIAAEARWQASQGDEYGAY
jgi:hypothetical protein